MAWGARMRNPRNLKAARIYPGFPQRQSYFKCKERQSVKLRISEDSEYFPLRSRFHDSRPRLKEEDGSIFQRSHTRAALNNSKRPASNSPSLTARSSISSARSTDTAFLYGRSAAARASKISEMVIMRDWIGISGADNL